MKKKWIIILLSVLLVIIIIIVGINCKKSSKNVGDIDVGDIDVGDIDVGDRNIKKNTEGKIEETVKQQYVFDDVNELKSIILKNHVGNISVKNSEDDKLSIETETNITVYNRKDLEIVKNSIEIQKSIEKEQCEISARSKEDGEDLWKWLDKNVENYNVSIEFTVKVPNNFDTFEFETECGNIEAVEIGGEMKIRGKVGNLLIDNCQFENKGILETETGNIQLCICPNLENVSSINVETKTGNIEIVSEENPMKYIKKGDNLIEVIINDKCNVTSKVETGTIRVNEERKDNEVYNITY